MNLLKLIPQTLRPLAKSAALAIDKAAPSIFVGIGLFGMAGAMYLTAKTAPIVEEKVKEVRSEEGKDRVDVAKEYVKGYYKPAAVFALSAASILLGHKMTLSRAAAVAAAYSLSEKNIKELKEAAEKRFGEKGEREIEETALTEPIRQIKTLSGVIDTGKGDTIFLEPISGRLFKSSTVAIDSAVNEVNRLTSVEIDADFATFETCLGLRESGAGKNLVFKSGRDPLGVRYVPEKAFLNDGSEVAILALKYEEPPKIADRFFLGEC